MDRNRIYKVVIDGKTVGELWPGQAGFFDVSPGAHRVRVKIDLMGSPELEVSLDRGQVIDLLCTGAGSAMAMFTTLFRRNSYLDLRPMTPEENETLNG